MCQRGKKIPSLYRGKMVLFFRTRSTFLRELKRRSLQKKLRGGAVKMRLFFFLPVRVTKWNLINKMTGNSYINQLN
jgi:hypothetical protein